MFHLGIARYGGAIKSDLDGVIGGNAEIPREVFEFGFDLRLRPFIGRAVRKAGQQGPNILNQPERQPLGHGRAGYDAMSR